MSMRALAEVLQRLLRTTGFLLGDRAEASTRGTTLPLRQSRLMRQCARD